MSTIPPPTEADFDTNLTLAYIAALGAMEKWRTEYGDDMPCGEEWGMLLIRRLVAAEARVAELEEFLHYCNGTCDLALKHRDAAEKRVAELEAGLREAPEVLCNVAQLLDGWHNDGTAWTEWDESVRKAVSELQAKVAALLGATDSTSQVRAVPQAPDVPTTTGSPPVAS